MKIEIKPLCKELNQEYLDFFDMRAFSDDHPNGPCYCTGPTMTKEVEKKMVSEFGDDIKGTIRKYAVDMLNNEMINGYLAFDDGVSIAWCNAADMESYEAFVPQLATLNSCGRTISIVCFEVAPDYRNKGIALALINRICSDAKQNGYVAVEGYVTISDGSIYDFTGPKGLYEKAGFSEVIRNEEKIVMRLML